MIDIENVSKWYGEFQVLRDCSTQVARGDVVVVCGPSGSGKSTLIKTVNGLEPFQQGSVRVDGIAVGDPKTDLRRLRAHIGMVFQNFELFPHLSVRENLTLAQIKVLGRSKLDATKRGLAYDGLGQPDRAIADYTQVIARTPNDAAFAYAQRSGSLTSTTSGVARSCRARHSGSS